MLFKFNWNIVCYESIGNNPPLPVCECMIGRDKNGVTLLCRVTYCIFERRYMVRFDTDVTNDDGKPFLRHKVVNAANFWKAMQDYHKTVFCDYISIHKVIEQFIYENELE